MAKYRKKFHCEEQTKLCPCTKFSESNFGSTCPPRFTYAYIYKWAMQFKNNNRNDKIMAKLWQKITASAFLNSTYDVKSF